MNNQWLQHLGVDQSWLAPVHESCLWTSLPNSTFRSLKSTTVGVFIPILAFSPESQLLNIYQHITALFYKQLTPRWGRDQLRDSRGCGPEGSSLGHTGVRAAVKTTGDGVFQKPTQWVPVSLPRFLPSKTQVPCNLGHFLGEV